MSERIKFKRGNSFILACQYKGGPITGWTIKSQLRKNGELVAELTVTIVNDATGDFKLEYSGDTLIWPASSLSCDIRYTTDTGQVISTETFLIEVVKEITHDEQP